MSDISNKKCRCFVYRLKEHKNIAYIKINGCINYDRVGNDRYYLEKLDNLGYKKYIIDLNNAFCDDLIDPLYGFPNFNRKRLIVILAKKNSQVVKIHFHERLKDMLSNMTGETIIECISKLSK